MKKKVLTYIVCRRKQNGNMRHVRVHEAPIILVMMLTNLINTHGTRRTLTAKPRLSVESDLISGVCMICMAMYGNGYRIGMAHTLHRRQEHRQKRQSLTRLALNQAKTVSSVVAAGTMKPGIVDRHPASACPLA